jgi:hypothetical protein
MVTDTDEYFRRDQADGVTAPDLTKDCSFSEHIVRARGKRTQLTSLSLTPDKIRDFGPVLYQARRTEIDIDGHTLVRHSALMDALRDTACSSSKEERARAIQAQRYAKRRMEGLLQWSFDTSGVDRKNMITWAFSKIQKYFGRA